MRNRIRLSSAKAYSQIQMDPLPKQQSFRGFTLLFTNDGNNGDSEPASDVVARLNFYSADWSHSRYIPYGVWLNAPCNCTEMEIGAVEELVLCLLNGEKKSSLRDLRVDINKDYREYIKEEDVSWFSNIMVKLIDQGSGGVSKIFALRVWQDGMGPCHAEVTPPENVQHMPW